MSGTALPLEAGRLGRRASGKDNQADENNTAEHAENHKIVMGTSIPENGGGLHLRQVPRAHFSLPAAANA
ncbi:hypothetical protein [Castellaniella sp.]|uniref:hypothetical protein n=1 Tax=Castellaniella sp. TaxID=1955812 RepID=UPI003567A30A